jgi:hypothetical protein
MPIRIVRNVGIYISSGRLSVALCGMVAREASYMTAILDAYSEVRESSRNELEPGCLDKGYNQFVPLICFVRRSIIGYRGNNLKQRSSTTRGIVITDKLRQRRRFPQIVPRLYYPLRRRRAPCNDHPGRSCCDKKAAVRLDAFLHQTVSILASVLLLAYTSGFQCL